MNQLKKNIEKKTNKTKKKKTKMKSVVFYAFFFLFLKNSSRQHVVYRLWNENPMAPDGT